MKGIALSVSFLFVSIGCAFSAPVRQISSVGLNVPPYGLPALSTEDFNRLAKIANVPFHYDGSKLIPPGYTPELKAAYLLLVEMKRREVVAQELAQGGPVTISTDFTDSRFSSEDREFVRLIVKEAAPLITELYEEQKGALKYRDAIFRSGTPLDRQMFERNQGPWCEATLTQSSPFCNAHLGFPRNISGAYPQDEMRYQEFCAQLQKLPNGKALTGPFTVVRRQPGGQIGFEAVPLPSVYGLRMKKVASILKRAADVYPIGQEIALRNYLRAAALGFETNDWETADEAWVEMNADNSKWYIRIAPDEQGFDPCGTKAGFQLSFALVSAKSSELKGKLEGLKQQMEDRLAALIGSPYKSRAVAIHTPEFIDIVWNAGDSRNPLGAVAGETLPNWGRVADKNITRLMGVTNFYTDEGSVANRIKRAKLFFTDEALKYLHADAESNLIGTVVHEVAHNMGPNSAYKINGELSEQRFGSLSGVLEEYKAQTGSSWYLPFLAEQGVFTASQLKDIYTSNIFWCFNQISYSGLFTAGGKPKSYGQLATIQVEMLMEDGALVKVETPDGWRLDIDFSKVPASFERMMKTVGRIKAFDGPSEEAKKKAEEFVDYYIGLSPDKPGKGFDAELIHEIAKRYRVVPKESFNYAIRGTHD